LLYLLDIEWLMPKRILSHGPGGGHGIAEQLFDFRAREG
jgi:hypothetical protein